MAGAVLLRRTPHPFGAGGFEALTLLLKERFPELPPGFTLREGLARAREAEPQLDWGQIDDALRAYEGHRYGGMQVPSASVPALARLSYALRRPRR